MDDQKNIRPDFSKAGEDSILYKKEKPKTEREKLKELHGKDKIWYLVHYYGLQTIVALAIIGIISFLIIHYVTQKDTALEIMKSGKNPNFCESDIELMNEFYLEYKNAKKAFQLKRNNGFEDSSSAVNLLNDTIKEIRLGISDKISASLEYQCDLAIYVCYEMHPSRTKDFCWEIFGNQIIKNIEANSTTPALLPVPSDDGDIYYLGKTYKVMEVNV